LVDYRPTVDHPFEIFSAPAPVEVLVSGLKAHEEQDTEPQTDTEWALDGLENHGNFVVQLAACLAAVPMGIWEHTVGSITEASPPELQKAKTQIEQLAREKPIPQALAHELANALAAATSQAEDLPSAFSEQTLAQKDAGMSPMHIPLSGRWLSASTDRALEIEVPAIRLGPGKRGSPRGVDLSLEARVVLRRCSDGQELAVWSVHYRSNSRRISDWTAHEGLLLQQEFARGSNQIAESIASSLSANGYLIPGPFPRSSVARN
jgi:hypothetical protein